MTRSNQSHAINKVAIADNLRGFALMVEVAKTASEAPKFVSEPSDNIASRHIHIGTNEEHLARLRKLASAKF